MPPKVVRVGEQKKSSQQKQYEEEQDLYENINQDTLQKNSKKYSHIRSYGALNTGIVTGLLGLSGFMGILAYVIMFFIVSAILLQKTNFKAEDYFIKKSDILYGGIGADVTLFLMSWVVSHNLVNIL